MAPLCGGRGRREEEDKEGWEGEQKATLKANVLAEDYNPLLFRPSPASPVRQYVYWTEPQQLCHIRESNPERPACALARQGTHPRSASTQARYGSHDGRKKRSPVLKVCLPIAIIGIEATRVCRGVAPAGQPRSSVSYRDASHRNKQFLSRRFSQDRMPRFQKAEGSGASGGA